MPRWAQGPNDSNAPTSSGMPDVDLVVSESKRVLDVGGTTMFQIRLRNYGTKEATNLQVNATLSDNLEVQEAQEAGRRTSESPDRRETSTRCLFDQISKLGPGKEMILGILVKVVGDTPKLATCKVVTHPRRPVRHTSRTWPA